jgi:murein DD-endopeptidase MepM/ murein hydrolase activator NlpD
VSRTARESGPWATASGRRARRSRRALTLTGIGLAAVVAGTALAAALAGAATAPGGDVLGLSSEATVAPAATPPPEAPRPAARPARSGVIATDQYRVPERRFAENPIPLRPTELTGYRWPLRGGWISGEFGPSWLATRIVDGERFHDGLDLASFCGDQILAAHDGVVLAAGRRFDQYMGWRGDLTTYTAWLEAGPRWSWLPITVVIDDGNGYRSVYAHLSRTIVKPGQRVKAGRIIGYEGATGRARGCHLHYGLFSPYEPTTFGVDPDVVKRMRVPAAQTARIDPLLVLPARPTRGSKPAPPSAPTLDRGTPLAD